MITQSDTIGKIVEALSKAQSEFNPIIKDVKAHHHKYAPLDACFNSTRKHLNDNGLIVTQTMDVLEGGRSVIVTTLGHVSGEFFRSYSDLSHHIQNAKGPNPLHSWGSVVTYTRRYAYLLIIGAIGEDEDNDGMDIQHKNDKIPQSMIQKGNSPQVNPEQEKVQADPLVAQLLNLIKSSGCDVGEFTKFHHISSKDLLSVKNSIDNFDKLLISFRERSQKISTTTEQQKTDDDHEKQKQS